jgi:hypothetical protein
VDDLEQTLIEHAHTGDWTIINTGRVVSVEATTEAAASIDEAFADAKALVAELTEGPYVVVNHADIGVRGHAHDGEAEPLHGHVEVSLRRETELDDGHVAIPLL